MEEYAGGLESGDKIDRRKAKESDKGLKGLEIIFGAVEFYPRGFELWYGARGFD